MKRISHVLFTTLAATSAFFLFGTSIASAESVHTITVRLLNADGTEQSSFPVVTANEGGGAVVAAADLGDDGIPELLVANGIGNEPRVFVYQQDGTLIGSFLAYSTDMGVGITLATCDVNGDGKAEIVTGTQYGGAPEVRVFDNMGTAIGSGFYAYAEQFRGGVNVACGDLDGDGKAEIVTGAGLSGGPHVRVWKANGTDWTLSQEFFPFDASLRSGVLVTVRTDGTLVTATQAGSPTEVKTYVIHSSPELIGDELVDGGSVGIASIAEANGQNMLSFLNNESVRSTNGTVSFPVESPTGTSNLVGVDLDQNGTEEFVAVPGRPSLGPAGDKYILVDISEERMYIYRDGILANTFLTSTAKAPFQTPLGIHHILAKKPVVDYTWVYGVGDPRNYHLPNTPWNLMIEPHIYIHDAWWHNNFGHPMSHGCINLNLVNSKWVYDFADVGTPVEVRE